MKTKPLDETENVRYFIGVKHMQVPSFTRVINILPTTYELKLIQYLASLPQLQYSNLVNAACVSNEFSNIAIAYLKSSVSTCGLMFVCTG